MNVTDIFIFFSNVGDTCYGIVLLVVASCSLAFGGFQLSESPGPEEFRWIPLESEAMAKLGPFTNCVRVIAADEMGKKGACYFIYISKNDIKDVSFVKDVILPITQYDHQLKITRDKLKEAATGSGINIWLYLTCPSVEDLSPLVGLPIIGLDIQFSGVTNLSHVRAMPLEDLIIRRTKITDLSPLRNMQTLKRLDASGTYINDISPLRGLKLRILDISDTRVVDFTPIQGMSLEKFRK